jgi:hypothetical protein
MRNARIDGQAQITEYIQVKDGDTVRVTSIYQREPRYTRASVADIVERIKKD